MTPPDATSTDPARARRRVAGAARRLAVVVNGRASGGGPPARLLDAAAGALHDAGGRVEEALVTHGEAELRALLEAAAGEVRVVLVGGDGTVHAAANVPGEVPELALIPAGRANNVARALGIPERLEPAARVAAGAPARRLDALRVRSRGSTRHCVEALSAGLQADARVRYDGENSADLAAGGRALGAALLRYRPYGVELGLDGSDAYRGEAAQVFLANLPLFGFGFRVNPLADPADGAFEAMVLPAASRVAAVRLLVAAYRGRHLSEGGTLVRRARAAEIAGPLPLVCDGTPLGVATASVTVAPGRLSIAAPATLDGPPTAAPEEG